MPRLLWKCDILSGQINDKFQRVEGIQRKAVIKEDKVVQYACRCRMCYYLYSCQVSITLKSVNENLHTLVFHIQLFYYFRWSCISLYSAWTLVTRKRF